MLAAKLNITILLNYFFRYITTSSREKTMDYHELYVNNVYTTFFCKNNTHMFTGVRTFFVTTNVI